jgi:integrase
MPDYRKNGKILIPLTDDEFAEGMENGYFAKESHKAFVVLLFYSGVRKQEALRALRKQFRITNDAVIFSVGKRLKHGIETPPLTIPSKAPYVNLLIAEIEQTFSKNSRIFEFSAKTAYNIVSRVFNYPHLFRLSRITNFFAAGYNIAQVRSWTGLTLKSLDFYVGIVDVKEMGQSLLKKKVENAGK